MVYSTLKIKKEGEFLLLNVFVRTLILYVLVILVMRLMGKRQIGQLQPFELAGTIMISELAAIPMQNLNIPLLSGIIPILTLLSGQIIISLLSYVSPMWRKLFDGKPSVLVDNGKIRAEELSKEMYTVSDVLEQLRLKNFPYIEDVEFALLETNGELSIIPKSGKNQPTLSDLNLPSTYRGLPLELITDGKIIHENLKKLQLSEYSLQELLRKNGASDIRSILLASIDSTGKLYYQIK